MAQFNDKQQNKKLKEVRDHEQEDLAQLLATRNGYPYINLNRRIISTTALKLVDEDRAREVGVAGFELKKQVLSLATLNPTASSTAQIIDELTRSGYQVVPYIVTENSINLAWESYGDISYSTTTEQGHITILPERADELSQLHVIADINAKLLDDIHTTDTYKTSRIVESIVLYAISLGSSDIHLETNESVSRLRYRTDGIMTEIVSVPEKNLRLVRSRIKVLSSMKLNLLDEAQDGRFSVGLPDRDIEMRVSFIPSPDGESIVIRILDPESLNVSISQLGMNPVVQTDMEYEINRANGLILNTGPTGSGKTTTLYTFLREIRSEETKIITIEDPIEYRIDGIVQSQTNDDYGFAEGLRSIVRQDPDSIMVGEIRDGETAEIAIQASLTGHLVFSTLHTNDAAGTFPRLINLGVTPDTLGASITVAMAQRLVRKLCVNCKQATPLSGRNQELANKHLSNLHKRYLPTLPQNTTQMFKPVGCNTCSGSGYKGRCGIFEIILMSEELATYLTSEHILSHEIKELAIRDGNLSIEQDAIIKILSGITDFEETERVIDL